MIKVLFRMLCLKIDYTNNLTMLEVSLKKIFYSLYIQSKYIFKFRIVILHTFWNKISYRCGVV